MVQQVISKCQTEHKLWDQTLYNGPQVLIIDGPVYNSSMLNIAKSISRMMQYNYPGIESTVINAMNSPGIDFVTYRILNNCNSDLVSIVCGADVKLLQKFKQITGCPIIINTSFNVRGEPIVNTPEDAFKCFMGNNLDILVIGKCYLKKENQDPNLILNYANKFKLD